MTPGGHARARAPAWLVDVPFAHRGLHGPGVPENSLPAFAAAASAGYGVELDVRLSRDGEPVVVHDPRLARMTGVDAAVAGLRAAELTELRLAGTDARLPRLAEALVEVVDVPLMVEVKSRFPRAGRIARAVAGVMDGHPGPWCVASFDPWVLSWFRRNRPRVARVLTAMPAGSPGAPGIFAERFAQLRPLARVVPAAVSYQLEGLPNPATDRWRDHGGTLLTWTAVGVQGLRRARGLADNVIFEHVLP